MSGVAEVLMQHTPVEYRWDTAERGNYAKCACGWDRVGYEGPVAMLAAHQSAKLAEHGVVRGEESGVLKHLRGELKSFAGNLDAWESQGHTTVSIRFLRALLGRLGKVLGDVTER